MSTSKFLEVEGYMYKILPVVTFPSKTGGEDFQKRDFILETRDVGRDGKLYKNLIRFETTKSFINEIVNIGEGSEVKVHFLLGGKEWQKDDATEPLYINFLRCWKVDVISNTNQEADIPVKSEPKYQEVTEDSDLPF